MKTDLQVLQQQVREKLALDWNNVGRGLMHAGTHGLVTVPAGALVGMLTADKGHEGEVALRGGAIGAGVGLGTSQIAQRVRRHGAAQLAEAAARGINLDKSDLARFSTTRGLTEAIEARSPGYHAAVDKRIETMPLYPEKDHGETLTDRWRKAYDAARTRVDDQAQHLVVEKNSMDWDNLGRGALHAGKWSLVPALGGAALAAALSDKENRGRNALLGGLAGVGMGTGAAQYVQRSARRGAAQLAEANARRMNLSKKMDAVKLDGKPHPEHSFDQFVGSLGPKFQENVNKRIDKTPLYGIEPHGASLKDKWQDLRLRRAVDEAVKSHADLIPASLIRDPAGSVRGWLRDLGMI